MTRSARTTVNRAALGTVGLSLFLVGAWLAATDRALADRLSSWWPATGTGTDGPAQWRGEGWWTPTVTAAAIGLTVLFVYVTLVQLHSRPTRRPALPSPSCTLRPQALAEALTARATALPGITRSRARVLPRRGRRLEVELRVWLEPDTPPDAVLPALRAVTAEAGRAAQTYAAHTRVRLSAAPHRKPHVR